VSCAYKKPSRFESWSNTVPRERDLPAAPRSRGHPKDDETGGESSSDCSRPARGALASLVVVPAPAAVLVAEANVRPSDMVSESARAVGRAAWGRAFPSQTEAELHSRLSKLERRVQILLAVVRLLLVPGQGASELVSAA